MFGDYNFLYVRYEVFAFWILGTVPDAHENGCYERDESFIATSDSSSKDQILCSRGIERCSQSHRDELSCFELVRKRDSRIRPSLHVGCLDLLARDFSFYSPYIAQQTLAERM